MCAVVRLRALMARQAARLITNPPIERPWIHTRPDSSEEEETPGNLSIERKTEAAAVARRLHWGSS
jgi:hypothetical protein